MEGFKALSLSPHFLGPASGGRGDKDPKPDQRCPRQVGQQGQHGRRGDQEDGERAADVLAQALRDGLQEDGVRQRRWIVVVVGFQQEG